MHQKGAINEMIHSDESFGNLIICIYNLFKMLPISMMKMALDSNSSANANAPSEILNFKPSTRQQSRPQAFFRSTSAGACMPYVYEHQ